MKAEFGLKLWVFQRTRKENVYHEDYTVIIVRPTNQIENGQKRDIL